MRFFSGKSEPTPEDLIDRLFTPPPESSTTTENLLAQMNGFAHMLTLVKEEQSMTIDTVIELHRRTAIQNPEYIKLQKDFYMAPEVRNNRLRGMQDTALPGSLRNFNWGSPIIPGTELTEDGVVEILQVIKSESNFPEHKGTWLHPESQPNHQSTANDFHYYHNMKAIQGKTTNEQYAKNLFERIQSDLKKEISWTLVFPRTTDINAVLSLGGLKPNAIADYMRIAFTEQMKAYEQDIARCKTRADKIKVIVKTIKSLLRTQILGSANHSVFVLEILNFFLIKEKIGLCTLSDRRQFILNGLRESTHAVKKNLFQFKTSTNEFCDNLLVALYKKIIGLSAKSSLTKLFNETNYLSDADKNSWKAPNLFKYPTAIDYLQAARKDLPLSNTPRFITIPPMHLVNETVCVILYIPKNNRELTSVCLIDNQDRNETERLKIAKSVKEKLHEVYPDSDFNIHYYLLNKTDLTIQDQLVTSFIQAMHHCYNRTKCTEIHFVKSYHSSDLPQANISKGFK